MIDTRAARGCTEAEATDAALARATLFGALALGFGPPTPETMERLSAEHARRAFRAAARLLHPDPGGSLRRAVAAMEAAAAGEARRLGEDYTRLFGHTARGVVSPFETEYGVEGLFQQPQQLADAGGYYAAFGMRVSGGSSGRIDHVGCECEFLDFLCRKEAYGREAGDAEMVEVTTLAYRSFLRDHLGRFGRSFATQLVKADDRFYGRLGALLHALLGLEAERLGIPAGQEMLPLRSAEEDAVPMACGGPACADVPDAGRRT
jgi:TorA maturation chaperone TorD